MNRIDTHVYFLRYLSVTTSYQRRRLLQTATAEQLNVLYEIAFNVLQGNISLTDEDYSILYKHRNVLRKLTLKEIDRYTKRQLLGKYSCAVKDLLGIFFNYYPSKDTENAFDFLPNTELIDDSDEDVEEEEEEEEEITEKQRLVVNEPYSEIKQDHDRPEQLQNLHTHTTVTLPTTAEAAPESAENPVFEPTKSEA